MNENTKRSCSNLEIEFEGIIYTVELEKISDDKLSIIVQKKNSIQRQFLKNEIYLDNLKHMNSFFQNISNIDEAIKILETLLYDNKAKIGKKENEIGIIFLINEEKKESVSFPLSYFSYNDKSLINLLISKINILEEELECCKKRISFLEEKYEPKKNEKNIIKTKENIYLNANLSEENDLYDYFFYPIHDTQELIIYNSAFGWKRTDITEEDFEDENIELDKFCSFSRSVNLGSSLLITGGLLELNPTSNCYLIQINKERKGDSQIVKEGKTIYLKVSRFENMMAPRKRHSIIYLPDRNFIICCGGENNKTVELYNLNIKGKWESLGSLNSIRWNSNMAYINQKFIYTIGGYTGGNFGFYLNNFEFIDLDSNFKSWKTIDITNTSFKSDSLGIIPVNRNSIYLVGGYYYPFSFNSCYNLRVENDFQEGKVYLMDKKLPQKASFINGNFIQFGSYFFNVDYDTFNVIIFDKTTGYFSTLGYKSIEKQ